MTLFIHCKITTANQFKFSSTKSLFLVVDLPFRFSILLIEDLSCDDHILLKVEQSPRCYNLLIIIVGKHNLVKKLTYICSDSTLSYHRCFWIYFNSCFVSTLHKSLRTHHTPKNMQTQDWPLKQTTWSFPCASPPTNPCWCSITF